MSFEIRVQRRAGNGDAGEFNAGTLEVSLGREQLFQCQTLELPWKDNQRNISCIPEGTYPFIKRRAGTFYERYRQRWGHEFTIQVGDVPDRDFILVHIGNYLVDTRGCILVGNRFRYKGRARVENSTQTYKRLYSVLTESDSGVIYVSSAVETSMDEGELIVDRSFL